MRQVGDSGVASPRILGVPKCLIIGE